MAPAENMPSPFIKRFLPRSLFGRALLILVLSMVVLQAVVLYIFYEEHWRNVEWHLAHSLTGDVALLVYEMKRGDEQHRKDVEDMARQFLHIRITREPADLNKVHFPSVTDDTALEPFTAQLRSTLDEPFLVHHPRGNSDIFLDIQLKNNVLHMEFPTKRLLNVTAEVFVWWMLGSALLLLLIATAFLRNQIRPIRKLAAAAEQFGKGLDIADFRPQGASEVRQAGRSFIAMRERLKRMISARTEMLAGISHDLRTPLTRMRLALAMFPDQKHVKPLLADVQDMEKMIQEYLEFARGETGEKPRRLLLSDLIGGVVNSYAAHAGQVTLVQDCNPEITVFQNAMRRCLSNVIDNALSYGTRCEVRCQLFGRQVEITIDDDGPGIPPESRELAMQPFKRLDPSRNLDHGGAGLGLSIVQDIVLRHGGEVFLEDSMLGGLRVRIRLPL